MRKSTVRWWQLWIASLSLLLLVTACYQEVVDSNPPNAVSQLLPSPTIQPTNTPTATATDTPEAVDQPISDLDTPTPTPSPTEAVIVAQVPELQSTDPFVLTATQRVAEVTQTAEMSITLTAIALGLGATPTPTATATTLFPVTNTPVPPLPGVNCVHEVRAGENLFRLSLRYGVTVESIVQATNNSGLSTITNINVLRVGQPIVIPGCGTTGVTPPPTSIPTVPSIPGQTSVPPIGGGTTHTVRQGETLFQISLRYGVPVESIAAVNGLANINLIYIGQELVIPAS